MIKAALIDLHNDNNKKHIAIFYSEKGEEEHEKSEHLSLNILIILLGLGQSIELKKVDRNEKQGKSNGMQSNNILYAVVKLQSA